MAPDEIGAFFNITIAIEGAPQMVPSQYDRSEKIVKLIHGVFGFHPTYRAFHAVGDIYRGTFTPIPEAKKYTRAMHFQQPVPATVRFSGGGGNPDAPPSTTAGMATKFYLPTGRVTDLIALNAVSFVAKTVDELVGLIEAIEPDPVTGKKDDAKAHAYISSIPSMAAALALRKQIPAPVSFSKNIYNAVHVFRFLNEKGDVTHVKYHWVPEDGVEGQSVEVQQSLPRDYLFTEMQERIKKGPVRFTLELEIGEEGDPLDDPTALWPEGRKRVAVGKLELVARTSVEEIGDPVMQHDPTRITDGIQLTDDPIIEARRGAYDASVADRSGGWRSCPFAKIAGPAAGAAPDPSYRGGGKS
ncbi:MAG: catalase [Aestuariivirga sp.]|uniref:catalase n=1 Tax=Aestuariivirga sp. TaxID=2650926 RepID=UPI0038D0520E